MRQNAGALLAGRGPQNICWDLALRPPAPGAWGARVYPALTSGQLGFWAAVDAARVNIMTAR